MGNKEVKIGDLKVIGNTLFVINKVDDQMFHSQTNFEFINNKINFGERCSFCHSIGREPKESEIQEFFFAILYWYNKKYCVDFIKDYLSDSDYYDISDRVSYHLNLETDGDTPYCQLIYDIRDYIWNNITEEDVSIKRITDIKEKWGRCNLYCAKASHEVYNIIDKYENLSWDYCIKCGKPSKYISKGWISPYCEDCIDKEHIDHYVDKEEYSGYVNDLL